MDGLRRRAAALAVAASVAAGCSARSVETSLDRRTVEDSGPADVHVLSPCGPGQAPGEDGCRDVVVTDPAGQQINLRTLALDEACSAAWSRVQQAAERRRMFTAVSGRSLQQGIDVVDAECTARARHLEVCQRAGYFDTSPSNRACRVRCQDHLNACRRLGRIYRDMVASGLKVTQ